MKSGKWWLLLFVPFVTVVVGRDETACRTTKDCKGVHEECMGGMCHCEQVIDNILQASCQSTKFE